MMAGGVYNGIIWTRLGMDAARSWLTGYWLEFIFSMENVFIFHVVASGFRMSWAHSQKALIIVICFQICFQMVFYMGLAELLTSIWALPYLLGAWLVYVGLSTLKDDHSDSDHLPSKESQKPLTPAEGSYVSVAPFLSGYVRCFSTVLGERFECGYGEGPPSFLELNGKTKATLLVPALAALLAVDFIMEIDVTLTKIMEIQHGFIAFTSSVAAAFAVPDLFFVAQDLLSEFRLLKYGVSFVLVFFGTLLLLHQVVNLNDMVCIGIIMSMMGLCAYLSWLIPPPIQQQTDDISPTQRGRPEDLGFVDGCPEVTPSDCEEDMSQTHGPSLKQHPQSDGDAK
jgi:tellurite resistance protein TerC